MTSPFTTEALLALMQARRTCYQFADAEEARVDRQALLHCLDAARWAPNHKLTQPWHYWWLGENSKSSIADIYADLRARKSALHDATQYEGCYQQAREKFMRLPEVILVGQALAEDPVVRKEDYAACAAGLQNFQLLAWQQGIGVQWSSGPILKDPRTYAILGVDPLQVELIGALYIGMRKTDCAPPAAQRKPLESILTELD